MAKPTVIIVDDKKNSRILRNEFCQGGFITGVCSGIAEYFNINVNILRIIWVISIGFFGFGALAYVLMTVILPAKK
jgi:phage shock protein PspC (stress-responsive transcriptional regulator)